VTRKREIRNRFCLRLTQTGETCPPQLQRFADVLGTKVYGPYGPYSSQFDNTKAQWQVSLDGDKAVAALEELRPYMTPDGFKLAKALDDMESSGYDHV
jgi:hypothetical protein